MNRLTFGLLAVILAASPSICAAGPFVDKNLETAVRAALQEPTGELTDQKLANLSILHADGKEIKDLTGLEKCKGLYEIRLAKNQIADVKALKDLPNLQSLDLAGNQIADIASLAGLTRLQYLELSNNKVADVKP